MNLDKSRGPQSQRVADPLVEYGIIDLVRHFCQRRRFRNLKTWSQVRQGTVLQSRCDYTLGLDQRHFNMVGIRYMRKLLSDNFALSSWIFQRPTCFHARYLSGRRSFPFSFSPAEERSRVDPKLQTLKAL